jgi:putative transposase
MAKKREEKIRKELLDELLKDYSTPEDLLGKNGIMAELKQRLIERAMEAEMEDHLGYAKNGNRVEGSDNYRNGFSNKKVISNTDQIDIQVPRDREGNYEPLILPKHQRRFDGFDDKILAMYARGMSVRDIQATLLEIYNVEVSEGIITGVTDKVYDDVVSWQNRPLDPIYPLIFFDCIVVKSREDVKVSNRSVYVALAIDMEGKKEILGLWIAPTEGAKFWLGVMTELKNRGVKDLFVASIDGLKGLPEAIETVFPEVEVQLCIVHMIRNSIKYVNWKDRKEVCKDLKEVYSAATEDEASQKLEEFGQKWDAKYPTIRKKWVNNWDRIIPFFDYPEEIRKVMYTTNAIESINRSIRKVIKAKGAFPNDRAIFKILYLALNNASKKWTMPIKNWKTALNFFAIKFEGRFPE